jgi:hypothetical protein
MNLNGRKWKKLSGGGNNWNPQTAGESREYARYVRFEPSAGAGTSGKHHFECDGGGEEWVFDSKMLRDHLTDDVIGKPVKIVFDGKKKAQNGATYKRFDVYVLDV